MGLKIRRPQSFHLPLTPRVLLAVGVSSIFVSFVVTQLAQSEARQSARETQASRVQGVAHILAGRVAPLLEANDDLRLSMISASAAQFGRYRVVILDASGKVRIDTALALGGQDMQLLTAEGAFQRPVDENKHEFLAPAYGVKGLVGELRIQYPVLAAATAGFSITLFAGSLLACLSLLAVVGLLCHHWTSHVREAAITAQGMAHGDLRARCSRRASGVIRDLQDSLHDLGARLGDGAQKVEQSLLELAHQSVEMMERQGKVGHGERTREYAKSLTQRLGLSPEECREIETAASLHDLGELYEPPVGSGVQGRDEDPDRGELNRMRRIPERGADIFSEIPSLRRVAEIVRHHRERFDGSGFPSGLQGDRIPLGARIVGIADAYDQLTTVRRPSPLNWRDALKLLREERGSLFDPWLVDLFEEEIRKDPRPQGATNTVMISAEGVVPYQVVQVDPEGEAYEEKSVLWTESDAEPELEVLGDDVPGGDQA